MGCLWDDNGIITKGGKPAPSKLHWVDQPLQTEENELVFLHYPWGNSTNVPLLQIFCRTIIFGYSSNTTKVCIPWPRSQSISRKFVCCDSVCADSLLFEVFGLLSRKSEWKQFLVHPHCQRFCVF
jgi:hypothetical protein